MLTLTLLISYIALSIFIIYRISYYGVKIGWGTLIPFYFLVMLAIIPCINYIDDSYLSYYFIPNEEQVSTFYLYCILGFFSYYIGYAITRDKKYKFTSLIFLKINNLINITLNNNIKCNILLLLVILSTVWSLYYGYYGLVSKDSSDMSALSGPVYLIASFINYINIIFWVNYYKRDLNNINRIYPYITLFFLLISAFASNSKAAFIFPFLVIIFSRYFTVGKISYIKIIIIIILFFLVVYPIVTGYRYFIISDIIDKNPLDVANNFSDYVFSLDWIKDSYAINIDRSTALGRGIFSYLASIFISSGHTVDYLYGRTYLQGLENVIPRLLLPNKMDMNLGNWTGKLFGVVLDIDDITNVSPSYIGELYMNGGIVAIIIGMILLGKFARYIDSIIFKSKYIWLKVLFVLNISWFEGFTGTTIIIFIKTFLMFYIVLNFLNIFSKKLQ